MSSAASDYSSEKEAVLAQIHALLSAVPSKDITKLLEPCYPSGGAARKRGDEILISSIQEVCEAIPEIPGDIEERFIDPEVKIFEDLAMVWAECEIKIDGNVVAVGVNAITLHKINGVWKITSISDTARAPK